MIYEWAKARELPPKEQTGLKGPRIVNGRWQPELSLPEPSPQPRQPRQKAGNHQQKGGGQRHGRTAGGVEDGNAPLGHAAVRVPPQSMVCANDRPRCRQKIIIQPSSV